MGANATYTVQVNQVFLDYLVSKEVVVRMAYLDSQVEMVPKVRLDLLDCLELEVKMDSLVCQAHLVRMHLLGNKIFFFAFFFLSCRCLHCFFFWKFLNCANIQQGWKRKMVVVECITTLSTTPSEHHTITTLHIHLSNNPELGE